MGNLSRRAVNQFRAGFEQETQAAVAGLPPAYISGFIPTIGDDGILTIGAGIANVDGQRTDFAEQTVTAERWVSNQIGGLKYYVYGTRDGVYTVDIIAPAYNAQRYYKAHPFSGWRHILSIKLDANKNVQWANKSVDEFTAGNLTFTKAVASQTNITPVSGDARSFMGKDPEGNQASSDIVEIGIEEHNGEGWERHFNAAMRGDGTVADAIVSGFFRAGGGVYSRLGVAWKTSTNNFSGGVVAMVVTDANVVIALTDAGHEIERSTDNGVTFGADISNNLTGNGNGMAYFSHIDTTFAWDVNGKLIKSSDDGSTWSAAITNGFDTDVERIGGMAYDSVHKVLVMTGHNNTNCGVLRSTDDGVTWSLGTDEPGTDLFDIEYIGGGKLVAQRATNRQVFTSSDGGDTWSAAIQVDTAGTDAAQGLSYGDGVLMGSWVDTSSGTEHLLYYSIDEGETWTKATISSNTYSSRNPAHIATSFWGAGSHWSNDGGRSFTTYDFATSGNEILSQAYHTSVNRLLAGAVSGVTYYSDWLEAGSGIVAQDQSSDGYIQFSSGIIIQWAEVVHSSLAVTTAVGNIFRSAALSGASYPKAVTTVLYAPIPHVSGSGAAHRWIGKNTTGVTTSAWGDYNVLGAASSTANTTVHFFMIGIV